MKDRAKNPKQLRARRFNSKFLLAYALVAACAAHGWAAVVVQFGGDMVSTAAPTALMVLPTPTNNGATRTYAYSATTALTPSSNYTGPAFYGALQNIAGTGTNAAFARTRVVDGANPNVDEMDIWGSANAAAGQTNSITGFIFFKPTLSLGQTASFSLGDNISMSVVFSLSTAKDIRMAVMNNGVWYLSQTQFTTANSSLDPSQESWGVWNPSGAPIPAEPTTFATLGATFTDIEGVGFYANGSLTSASNQARIVATSFVVNATITGVPEPSTGALMGLSAAGMVLYVKRRRRQLVS